MKITEKAIQVLEIIFEIKLYPEQIEYLSNEHVVYARRGRRTGKTFIYCVKLALSEGEPINLTDYRRYQDEGHNGMYGLWFKNYFYDIWLKLKAHGFPVREVVFKVPSKRHMDFDEPPITSLVIKKEDAKKCLVSHQLEQLYHFVKKNNHWGR